MSEQSAAIAVSPHLLRIALGIVYFHFGVLKFFPDLSPAELIAGETITRLSLHWIDARTAIWWLAGTLPEPAWVLPPVHANAAMPGSRASLGVSMHAAARSLARLGEAPIECLGAWALAHVQRVGSRRCLSEDSLDASGNRLQIMP